MARSNIKVGGTGIKVSLEAKGIAQADALFKSARKELGANVREAVKEAAEAEVLPAARSRAGNLKVAGQSTAGSLVIRKGRSNSVYITTSMRGKKGRAVGLQEFGGTVRTPILPKHKSHRNKMGAIKVGPDVYRAAVKKARHYHGKKFLTGAVDERRSAISNVIARHLEETFKGLS